MHVPVSTRLTLGASALLQCGQDAFEEGDDRPYAVCL